VAPDEHSTQLMSAYQMPVVAPHLQTSLSLWLAVYPSRNIQYAVHSAHFVLHNSDLHSTTLITNQLLSNFLNL